MKSVSPDKQLQMLKKFIEVYCSKNHGSVDGQLCDECSELLDYATDRLAKCPMDPKPKCKDCPIHCYKPRYREKVREVMRFSGMYHVKRGRVDWLIRYFLGLV